MSDWVGEGFKNQGKPQTYPFRELKLLPEPPPSNIAFYIHFFKPNS